MLTILHLIGTFFVDLLFRSQRQLEVENLFLRHQLNIAVRRTQHRFQLSRSDRALLVSMTRLMPSLLDLTQGHLEKFFSPSRCESDSLIAMGHGRMERASHGADGLFRC